MAVKTKEELIEIIRTRIGDDNSDEAISLLEDVADTLEDMSSRAEGQEDWRERYEQNDKEWRDKYKARFEGKASGEEDGKEEKGGEDEEGKKPKTYEDLFKEGE